MNEAVLVSLLALSFIGNIAYSLQTVYLSGIIHNKDKRLKEAEGMFRDFLDRSKGGVGFMTDWMDRARKFLGVE